MDVDFNRFERRIVNDRKLRSTIVSYVIVLILFLNMGMIHSVVLGAIATFIFFLINATFLGNAFFEEETLFIRLMLGSLLLVILLAFTSWAVMIIYNLDVIRSTIALCVVTGLSSLMSRLTRRKFKLLSEIRKIVKTRISR